jgi:hypothetical protein
VLRGGDLENEGDAQEGLLGVAVGYHLQRRLHFLTTFTKERLPGLGWGANPGSYDLVYFFIPSLYR